MNREHEGRNFLGLTYFPVLHLPCCALRTIQLSALQLLVWVESADVVGIGRESAV